MSEKPDQGVTRREALIAGGTAAVGAALAAVAMPAQAQVPEKAGTGPAAKVPDKFSTVPLNWEEVYYTNCPLVSASNVDQELGWTREEYKKIGVKYAFLRSVRENNWYPHYIHNLDNLIRFGGLFPPVHVQADIRRTRLLGADACAARGRLHDGASQGRRLPDEGPEGPEDRPLQEPEHHQERLVAHPGGTGHRADAPDERHDPSGREIVEFPYADDWYDKPEMLDPMENPSELWLKRDHKRDLAFRPLETALEKGIVDAIYTQSEPFQHLQEATGKFKAIEDLSRYPDWTLQVANIPAVITCTDEMAEKHPELVVTFMKGMIKVGRWANEHKHAAAAILDKQTFYLDVEDTYRGIKDIDMVPNLSPQNLVSVEIGKDFMLSHGYIKNDFDVQKWAAPEFLEQAAKELLEAEWKKKMGTTPRRESIGLTASGPTAGASDPSWCFASSPVPPFERRTE